MQLTLLKPRISPKPLALSVAMALVMANVHSPQAHAEGVAVVAVSSPMAISVPAQPLGQALNELARQANLQMTYPAALVAGRQASAVSVEFTVRQVLDRLLAGTGLVAVVDGASVLIRQVTLAPGNVPVLPAVTVTAEQILKQAPGVSIISREDVEKRPPANDLSELVRTMPGVNLTGNSPSGQYGNNRQIDLRGMGPENTLILIDGVPVSSRNSTRMGRSGERNTRGDSNWVPAEAVDSIEVLRGPAAARYGSGASGGVVNIITRRPTEKLSGSLTYYTNRPEDDNEQVTNRVGFNLAGPIGEAFSFRFFGNANKTDADKVDLNESFATGATPPAGREGVRNRDANFLLRWDMTDRQVVELSTGFSRQGNIYAGDRAMNASYQGLTSLATAGAETNTKYRRTGSLVHRGDWGAGRTSRLSLAYEETDNRRLREGLSGGSEGAFLRDPTNNQLSASVTSTSELRNWMLGGEFNSPLRLGGIEQMLTVGFDARHERLDDPYSMSNANPAAGAVLGRSSEASARNLAAYVESNIVVTDELLVTPGLRYDKHSQFGNNWSPSLNASYQWTSAVSLKAGIARAFKAPNLYQSNPNYLWETNGRGCPVNWPRPNNSGCVILGNPDLEPEISVNKEIGIAYDANGLAAGLTYFHNNYDKKIVADMPDQVPVLLPDNRYLFRWENADKAVVRGFEGHFTIPLLGHNGDRLKWVNNFTYMLENRNQTTRQPLANVPEYTFNTTLDWRATEKLSVMLTGTFYGKQEPRTRRIDGSAATGDELKERNAYHLIGLSVGYTVNSHLKARVGVSNLLNKRLFREHNQSGAGAATYNEAGRAFYASLTASF